MDDQEIFHQEVEKKEPGAIIARSYGRPGNLEKAPTPVIAHQGQAVQYSLNGPGFSFATRSQKRLPSGIYSLSFFNDALTLVPAPVATDTILKLPDTRSDQLIEEIELFWSLKKEFRDGNSYAHGGFLHKRGYLLFGPPGSGKTSTLKLIMEALIERNGIVVLGNTNPEVVATALKNFRLVEPDRNVLVVLEDFDTLIERFGSDSYLSILDGEASIDGALFLATTNYASKFEPRIYNRPGRFSDVVYIGMPNALAREMYLRTKLKNFDDLEKIVAATEGFTLDHLRSLILGVYFEKKNLDNELTRLRKLFRPPKDEPNKTFGIARELL